MTNIAPADIRRALQCCYPAGEAGALARAVCCEMLGQRATDYYLGKDITLSANDAQKLRDILDRLRRYEPLQYVQGVARFLCRDFKVTPGVLIPRPETEELVEWVLDALPPHCRILDVGTGSGCIAVTLALARPEAEVTAWDVSDTALQLAQTNARALHARVQVERHDILDFTPDGSLHFDVIVSNPPYVTESEKTGMARNVLDWEPELALFVPDADPLRFYRAIAQAGQTLLSAGGLLFFEVNRNYASDTGALLSRLGYADVEVRKDLSGNPRFVKGTRP